MRRRITCFARGFRPTCKATFLRMQRGLMRYHLCSRTLLSRATQRRKHKHKHKQRKKERLPCVVMLGSGWFTHTCLYSNMLAHKGSRAVNSNRDSYEQENSLNSPLYHLSAQLFSQSILSVNFNVRLSPLFSDVERLQAH